MAPDKPEPPPLARFGRLISKLKADRHGAPVRFIRNYPLQYVVFGTTLVVIGILILPFTRGGLGLMLFGLAAFPFAAYYYYVR
jgi:hypothetical protein